MAALILFHLLFGVVGLVVLLVLVVFYRGRRLRHAERLTDVVTAVADLVDPGEAPPQGVLSRPEKARVMARRFERAEHKVRQAGRVLASFGRAQGRRALSSRLLPR